MHLSSIRHRLTVQAACFLTQADPWLLSDCFGEHQGREWLQPR